MSQFFTSDGQSMRASSSASVLPMNIQDWFPLRLTGLISLLSKGLSRVFCNTTVQKHQFFGAQLSLWSNSHIHTWLLEETIAMIGQTFVSKVMSLLFNILSGFLKLSSKKQENSRKTSTFALLTMPKPFTVWIKTNWKILQETGIPDQPNGLLRNL